MKRIFSAVYTVFVLVALISIVGFFSWQTYRSRADRIADFEIKADRYTRLLENTLMEERSIDREVTLAERILDEDFSLMLLQVQSPSDGLRLSVVKPVANELSRISLTESAAFSGLIERIRYYKVIRPMRVQGLHGLEAVFLTTTLSTAEIRNHLLIMLFAILGLFLVTVALIFIRGQVPSKSSVLKSDSIDIEDFSSEEDPDYDFSEEESDTIFNEKVLPSVEDFEIDEKNSQTEPEIMNEAEIDTEENSESLDFPVPIDDKFPPTERNNKALLERLEPELVRAASFNQDLSVLFFSTEGHPGENPRELEHRLRRSYPYKDLVFPLSSDSFVVIEINRDLDTALASTEDFVRDRIAATDNHALRIGIASRNGRLIKASKLLDEAEAALKKSNEKQSIVGFRSNPEKYRDYLKNKDD